ncbi:MAG TPA: hypothetical protein VFM82_05690 [Flavobacteriaceae bacterium]|nr:hypothetical protein [Flavobacteriaceae bacterium]
MSTTEIKQELHKYIDIGNDDFIQRIYEIVKAQLHQMEMDRMIEEGEEDIREGRVHSMEELKEIIKDWRK